LLHVAKPDAHSTTSNPKLVGDPAGWLPQP